MTVCALSFDQGFSESAASATPEKKAYLGQRGCTKSKPTEQQSGNRHSKSFKQLNNMNTVGLAEEIRQMKRPIWWLEI